MDPAVCASLADWLADQLSEERLLLEARHRTLCDMLRAIQLQDASGDSRVLAPHLIFSAVGGEPSNGQQCGASNGTSSSALNGHAALLHTVRPRKDSTPKAAGDDSLPKEVSEVQEPASDVSEPQTEISQQDILRPIKRSRSGGNPRRQNSFPISHSATVLRIVENEDLNRRNWLEKMVTSHAFEITFALLILLNAALIATEMQHKSYRLLSELESNGETWPRDLGETWPSASTVFEVFEIGFGSIFMLEVFLKIIAERHHFLSSGWNIFDTIVVTVWFVDHLSLISTSMILNPMILRVCRIARLLRLLRLVRMVEFFDTLTLMISSIRASVTVLVWGTILLLMIMMVCAMSFNSIISSYITDEGLDIKLRLQLFSFFGSFTRCMVTMFELTLGNWVPVCRLLLDNVGEWLGMCVLVYELAVSFAVVRVISGIFLHETFKCASMDDELMIKTQNRAKKRFTAKMRQLFHEMDTSNSGLVSIQQFKDIIADSRVQGWLLAMELNIKEPERVFSYLVGNESCRADLLTGEEVLHADELVSGMARLRGAAREFDLLILMAESHEVRREFEAREREHAEVWRLLSSLRSDVRDLSSGGTTLCA